MAAALAVMASLSAAMASDYIQADARFSGREIYSFQDEGRQVTIVSGGFRFTVGDRVLSSREAVLWVSSTDPDAMKHNVVVYLEGNAKVEDLGGASTTDKTMLVELHIQGRIVAAGRVVQKSHTDLPLYQRALGMLNAPQVSAEPQQQSAASVVTTPADEDERVDRQAPAQQGDDAAATPAPSTPPAAPEPAPVIRPQPLTFYADSFTSEVSDGVRTTIARGNVYLSLGDPDSNDFIELQAQRAVIFSEMSEGQEAATSPEVEDLLPRNDEKESITGVYLEDDVIISRGERQFTGPQAFYDFKVDRALVIDPVFRTRQEQRDIPIYIRASEARSLSRKQIYFRDASISTSDFHTPRYSINARSIYLEDRTRYDEEGVRVSQQTFYTRATHSTFRVFGWPVAYWPYHAGEVTQSHTALRKITVGSSSRFGSGVETEWHLFRLLGLVPPDGFKGTAEFNYYDRGLLGGVNLRYARENYNGYALVYGLHDRRQDDDFGRLRENILAPSERGRFLARHKQQVQGWEVQVELSYLCDRNFLEQFFNSEYWNGKEQETLIYAKKQQDNWAFTSLLQYRINRFLTQTESYPDFGFYMIGQPLLDDKLTYYNESHAGIKRWRPDNALDISSSDVMVRGDTRNEIDFPFRLGPVRMVHYATGRLSAWSDSPDNGDIYRPYGQVGLKASTDIWRQYNDVSSRLWDLRGLRHVITPYTNGFLSSTGGTEPHELYQMDQSIEGVRQMQGVVFGVDQRLTTVRGGAGRQYQTEWMRLNLSAGLMDIERPKPDATSDGRFFYYRPENSLPRNFINGEYTWHISDSTTFMTDANYDIDSGELGRANFALAIRRDPRLSYFIGLRKIRDYDSSIGTFGINYEINRKYRVSFFEQFDFDFRGRQNERTSFTITRKFERWYVSTTFDYNQVDDDFSLFFSIWPEGIPEVRIGMRTADLLSGSDRN